MSHELRKGFANVKYRHFSHFRPPSIRHRLHLTTGPWPTEHFPHRKGLEQFPLERVSDSSRKQSSRSHIDVYRSLPPRENLRHQTSTTPCDHSQTHLWKVICPNPLSGSENKWNRLNNQVEGACSSLDHRHGSKSWQGNRPRGQNENLCRPSRRCALTLRQPSFQSERLPSWPGHHTPPPSSVTGARPPPGGHHQFDPRGANDQINCFWQNFAPRKAFRHLAHAAIVLLTLISNCCLRTGYFSKAWKEATVVMIPKPDKPRTNPFSTS